MFGIGANELILILLFGFLIFGPDKLPALAKTIGKAIARFRAAQDEMNKVIKTEVYDPTADEPFKNPLDTLAKLEDKAKKEDKGESFTERKARYDKQRAAKKAAEAKRAEEAAKAAEEAGAGAAEAAGAVTAGLAAVGAGVAAAGSAEVKDVPETSEATKEEASVKKKISADELYATVPAPTKAEKKAVEATGTLQKAAAAAKVAAEKAEKAKESEVAQEAREAKDTKEAEEAKDAAPVSSDDAALPETEEGGK